MNFLEAELAEGRLRTPLGEVTLTDKIRRELEGANADRQVIVGIRPEHFEDAALISPEERAAGVTFETNIDVIESLGSDVFAHFTLSEGQASSSELVELAADSGAADTLAGGQEVIARLDAGTRIKEEDHATLWFDATKIQLFDPQSGRSLLSAGPEAGADPREGATPAPAVTGGDGRGGSA
jgi:multiple sugar transport system ATP-binding protein